MKFESNQQIWEAYMNPMENISPEEDESAQGDTAEEINGIIRKYQAQFPDDPQSVFDATVEELKAANFDPENLKYLLSLANHYGNVVGVEEGEAPLPFNPEELYDSVFSSSDYWTEDDVIDDPYYPTGYSSTEEEEANEPEQTNAVVMEFEPEVGLDVEEEPNVDEVLYSDLKKLAEYSQRLLDDCENYEFEDWMKAKIIKASDYVSDIWHRLDATVDFANTGFEQSDNMSL